MCKVCIISASNVSSNKNFTNGASSNEEKPVKSNTDVKPTIAGQFFHPISPGNIKKSEILPCFQAL